jgi:hypothetical protein
MMTIQCVVMYYVIDRRAESGGQEIGEATRDSPQGQNIFSDQYVLHMADLHIFHSGSVPASRYHTVVCCLLWRITFFVEPPYNSYTINRTLINKKF